MALSTKTFYDLNDLKAHLKTHKKTFYHSSQTSTVVPYDRLAGLFEEDIVIGDLSKLPSSMELTKENNLIVRGPVSWQDARSYLVGHGRNLMTSPTEQLALVTAGVATSCTGERCFSFGTMRSQVKRLKYLDFNGEEKELKASDPFPFNTPHLAKYQEQYQKYATLKNAPFPRFETATDLMIGTEGQLGIVTEVEITTTPDFDINFVFILLPRWEDDFKPHLEIHQKVQSLREKLVSVELLDSNCMNYLKDDEKLGNNQDVIFLEIRSEHFEDVYENFLSGLELTSIEQVFEITPNKFHHIRAAVPRAIFEVNSQMGVVKKGTDVQVHENKFAELLSFYREAKDLGIRYCLFGHFGDAHLHFNYMPSKEDAHKCDDVFVKLYDQVLEWQGSPFAEHGIGLLKQPYIKKFYSDDVRATFKELKEIADPHNQFFPIGFMSAQL
ncbi:MAG: FAD-binding oxidoreductase [Candidatus Caldatribacteriota bacterium]